MSVGSGVENKLEKGETIKRWERFKNKVIIFEIT